MPMPWQQSDVTETGFLFRSTEEGFQMSKPYGGYCRYDAILDCGEARWRVQVKSTSYLVREGVYRVRTCRRIPASGRRRLKAVAYTESEIDFMVIHVIPERTWYIIPFADLKGRKTVDLYSRKHKKDGTGRHYGRWSKYREAWDLFRQPAPCTCGRTKASEESSTTETAIPAPPLSPAPQPQDPVQP